MGKLESRFAIDRKDQGHGQGQALGEMPPPGCGIPVGSILAQDCAYYLVCAGDAFREQVLPPGAPPGAKIRRQFRWLPRTAQGCCIQSGFARRALARTTWWCPPWGELPLNSPPLACSISHGNRITSAAVAILVGGTSQTSLQVDGGELMAGKLAMPPSCPGHGVRAMELRASAGLPPD